MVTRFACSTGYRISASHRFAISVAWYEEGEGEEGVAEGLICFEVTEVWHCVGVDVPEGSWG